MNKFILTAIIVLISGCISIGDGMFIVSGEIVSHQGEPCESRIISQDEQGASSFNIRLVSGSFSVDYTVAPHPKEYTIEVVCGSRLLIRKQIRYRGEIKPGEVIELGQL